MERRELALEEEVHRLELRVLGLQGDNAYAQRVLARLESQAASERSKLELRLERVPPAPIPARKLFPLLLVSFVFSWDCGSDSFPFACAASVFRKRSGIWRLVMYT